MKSRAETSWDELRTEKKPDTAKAATFGDDTAFLKRHTALIELSDRSGKAKVAVCPAYQGRVMTSSAGGDSGLSFGWINRELITSGKTQPHINVFGGEDRFWLGPEGGQFSIFFAKGAKFELSDWFTPAAIDTIPYEVAKQNKSSATFRASFDLTNYSGTRFHVKVNRDVKLLTAKRAAEQLGVPTGEDVSVVAYETVNKIKMGQLAHLVKIILMRAPAEMKRAVQRIVGDDVE